MGHAGSCAGRRNRGEANGCVASEEVVDELLLALLLLPPSPM